MIRLLILARTDILLRSDVKVNFSRIGMLILL
jgi:hypothetical protein